MLKWLARKGEDSRVYMCIKEVKWDLETANPLKRATTLAMAQLVHRTTIIEAGLHEAFDRPLEHSRDTLFRLYTGLEDIRTKSRLELDATKANMRRLGVELPSFAVEHAKTTTRGLEVWMCTLGAGISPHLLDEVRTIWGHLGGSRDHVDQAIAHLREVERRTLELTGANGMQFPVSDHDWRVHCFYVPAMFREGELLLPDA